MNQNKTMKNCKQWLCDWIHAYALKRDNIPKRWLKGFSESPGISIFDVFEKYFNIIQQVHHTMVRWFQNTLLILHTA